MPEYRDIRMSFQIEDENGHKSSFQLYPRIDGLLVWNDILTPLLDWSERIKPLIAGRIVRITWSRSPALWGRLLDPPVVGCDIENVGLFRFLDPTGPRNPMSIDIPAINKAYFPDGWFNQESSEAQDFRDTLIGGLWSGENVTTFHDPYGIPFTTFEDGKLTVHQTP